MHRFTAVLTVAALLLALPLAPPAAAAPPPAGGFTFVHVTDTHVGAGQANKNVPLLFDEIARLPERPAFIINSGDLTENGSAQQYDLYRQFAARAGVPVYNVPGNHDARWSDAGKGGFGRRFGAPYRSFDHQGVHFVLLDSSVDAETHGHLDRAMLRWLADDLRRVGPERPVLIFAHHPIAYFAARFLDNDEELLAVIRGYNVAAVFTGHGHLHLEWAHNGVRYFMTAAAMDAGYKVISVAPAAGAAAGDPGPGWELRIQNKVVGQPAQALAPVPLGRPRGGPRLELLAPERDAGGGFDLPASGRLGLAVVARGFEAGVRAVEARVGLGRWEPLRRAGGDAGGTTSEASEWRAELDGSAWPPGEHELIVRATDAAGGTWSVRAVARKAPGSSAEPRLAWRFDAGSAIQGAPALRGGLVVFGADDGAVRALDARSGEPRWTYRTGGAVVSTPEVANGVVFAASADGRLYAIDLASGSLRWVYQAGSALVARPLFHADRVFVGAADGKMHAVDAATGQAAWTFAAGDLIRGRAASGRGMVFFGSWDGNVYALDAANGARRWVADLARQIYFAPANGGLLYHRGRVYATTPNDRKADGTGIWALDARDGRVRWKLTDAAGFSTPVVHRGRIAYHLTDGTVVAAEALTGRKVWSAATGWSSYDSSPLPAGLDLVLGSLGGRVTAVRSEPPGVAWKFQLGSQFIFANPAVAEPAAGEGAGPDRARVYVASMDGFLYAIDAPYRPAPPAAGLADLEGHWAADAARRLVEDGVVTGYPQGLFRPDLPVTRAELAAMVARFAGAAQPSAGYRSALADLEGHWAAAYVRALEEQGVVQGYPAELAGPRRFGPARTVTRAEAAAMLARATGVTEPPRGFRSAFTDVAAHWAFPAVAALEERGIVRGVALADGRLAFRPDAPITRAEAAALLDRLLE